MNDPRICYAEAEQLAAATGGHYFDQLIYTERATDWRGNDNIADSIFLQMAVEEHPVPTWSVCGAGTGGSSATIGRYIRYPRYTSRLCVTDPEHSVFHRHDADRDIATPEGGRASRTEGAGPPRVEATFGPTVFDRMMAVPDAVSIGAMSGLAHIFGRRVAGSIGTNLHACLALPAQMAQAGIAGAIVTLLCNSRARYADTYCDDGWPARHEFDWRPAAVQVQAAFV